MIDSGAVLKVLESCWSARTSSLWSSGNPARGQCGVTALVVQDHYGGEIVKTRVAGRWHFYNRIDGRRCDLTAAQFPGPLAYEDLASSREEAFADTNGEQYSELSAQFAARRTASSSDGEKPTMHDAIAEVSTEVLQAFADAWNRHDVDALLSFMTHDCVFEASTGPDVSGTRYVGREAVRAGFAQVWTTFPDAHWGNARHFVCGDRGVSEWTFTGTRADDTRVEVHGCDLFTFRGGKIALKNSYRKNRTSS